MHCAGGRAWPLRGDTAGGEGRAAGCPTACHQCPSTGGTGHGSRGTCCRMALRPEELCKWWHLEFALPSPPVFPSTKTHCLGSLGFQIPGGCMSRELAHYRDTSTYAYIHVCMQTHYIDDYICVSSFIQRSQLHSCWPFCTADFSTSPAMLEGEVIYRRPLLSAPGSWQQQRLGAPPSQCQPPQRWPGSRQRSPLPSQTS